MGELRKVGIRISRQTVKNILVEAGLTPELNDTDSWEAFLRRHADTLWQCDFASKKMWTARGLVDLYFLVFLHLGTRRCWISPCTASPDSAWVSQQARNFLIVADEMELAPTILMRDNDTKFTVPFDEVFTSVGVEIKRNTPRSPNLRAHVERFIQCERTVNDTPSAALSRRPAVPSAVNIISMFISNWIRSILLRILSRVARLQGPISRMMMRLQEGRGIAPKPTPQSMRTPSFMTPSPASCLIWCRIPNELQEGR